jgi:hypothetical protein
MKTPKNPKNSARASGPNGASSFLTLVIHVFRRKETKLRQTMPPNPNKTQQNHPKRKAILSHFDPIINPLKPILIPLLSHKTHSPAADFAPTAALRPSPTLELP